MTMTAAPNRFISFACERNVSSPSLSEMELTMHLPCTQRSPLVITSHLEESIMTGTRAISGSDDSRLRKFTISFSVSSRPSSILTSMICAPSSTCLRAIAKASSYCFSLIRRRNLRDPATLQRSPTLTKLISGEISSKSRPLN